MTMPTDLEIARGANLRRIEDIAEEMGIPSDSVEHHGREMAKISLSAIDQMGPPRAKYVLVTATNPTPLGEGKTTIAVGLAQGFKHIDRQAVVTLRQPSLGPTFGIKGGAAGGGYSQVVPMEEMNLHLTGDFHAITAANNLISALIDNHIYRGNQLSLGADDVTWKRVLDMNDRALRDIVTGLGGKINGVPRETGFDITAAPSAASVGAIIAPIIAASQKLRSVKSTAAVTAPNAIVSGSPIPSNRLGRSASLRQAVMLSAAASVNSTSANVPWKRTFTMPTIASLEPTSMIPSTSELASTPSSTNTIGPVTIVVVNRL